VRARWRSLPNCLYRKQKRGKAYRSVWAPASLGDYYEDRRKWWFDKYQCRLWRQRREAMSNLTSEVSDGRHQ